MTLPFRRRHNDAEASHDRARALMSDDFVGSLSEAEAAWLADHLDGCPECQLERDAYAADRALLRGLRDRTPEAPRDLWARTAAAIEREARSGRGRVPGLGQVLPPRGLGRIPLGVVAGALVVFVVVGTALLPHSSAPIIPLTTPGGSQVAIATEPQATAMVPQANRVAWVQRAADGSFSLVFADVDHACPDGDPSCAPLADSSPAPLALAAPPQAVILSPAKDQIAVVGSDAETAGSVLIVAVPTPHPNDTPAPSPAVTPTSPNPATLPPTQPATLPPTTATPSEAASPPPGGEARAIISGVTVVGSAGFSANGDWLAFSARSKDGPGGPNLYVWHVGDAEARQVTSDGRTFFAGWYGELVLASSVLDEPAGGEASPAPLATEVPSSPAASIAAVPVEAHPYSFLLDPASGARTDFALPDVWLPAIDPTGRFVTYWAGTVIATVPTADGTVDIGQVAAWRPANGHLVIDGWNAPLAATPSPAAPSPVGPPEESATSAPATAGPSAGKGSARASAAQAAANAHGASNAHGANANGASSAPASAAPAVGPAGTPIELAAGPMADFDIHFDPTGSRLAIWVLDTPEASAGRLWLVVLDPAAGSIDPNLQPMAAPGVQALRGFTIDTGRLAWATPAGQDGQPSSVQVLAWNGDDFGQVQSVPGGSPQIVR